MVALSAPPEYGTSTEDEKPEPLVKETRKLSGAVTVTLPLSGVRYIPVSEYDLSTADLFIATFPNDIADGFAESPATASVA